MKKILGLAIGVALCCISAMAEGPGTVVLNLQEYEALKQKTEIPSLPYVLSLADYRAEVGEKEVKVKASLRAILFSDRPVTIPLFKKETAVDKALVSGKPAILTANETGQIAWALLGKPGDEVNLELEFRSSVTQEGGFYASVLNIPLSGAKLTMDFPYDEVQARLNDQYRETRLDERKHSLFDAWVMGKESARLSWLPLSKSIQPSISSTQTIAVDSADPRIIRYTGKLKLSVGHRPITDLSLVMENGLGGASVSGRNVGSYRGNDNRLDIHFSEPVIGQEELSIAFTHPIQENESLEFMVPHFQIEGAKGISGYVVFTQSSLYKATILEQEKVYPVAPDQVPDSALRNSAAQAFRFLAGDYQLKYRLEPIQPEFTAALYHGVSFGETTCILDTRCECTISQGAIHTFDLTQPEGFNLEAVSGDEVQDWSVSPDKSRVQVVLRRPERQKAIFSIKYRRNYEDREKLAIQFPVIADPKRFRGFVAVTPQTAIGISMESTENLEPLEAGQVPTVLTGQTGAAPLFAYRFLEQPASLSLTTQRYEIAQVETTLIKSMIVALKYTAQGTLQTDLFIEVKNTLLDMLPVEVFPDISIRECEIDGLPMEPARGETENTLLFPIPKSQNSTTTILLSYLSDCKPLSALRAVDLPIPKVTIPVDELGLLLSVPAPYRIALAPTGPFEPSQEIPLARLPERMVEKDWISGPSGDPGAKYSDELRRIAVAMETYYIDNNSYPPSLLNLTTPVVHLSDAPSNLAQKYVFEADPLSEWRVGFERTKLSGQKAERKMGEGVFYKASFLRGTPETIKQRLAAKAEIGTGGAMRPGILAFVGAIVVIVILLVLGRKFVLKSS